MGKWLPSRKISLFFVILAIIVAGVFLIFNGGKIFYESKEKDGLVVSNILRGNISEKDSDNDGLKDWEEELWGLDPSNPDTDGDGILDGDEELEKKTDTFLVEQWGSPETDLFSRIFLSKYIELKQKGESIDESSVSNLLTEVVNQSLASNTLYDGEKYNTKNIHIVKSTEKTTEAYKMNFMSLLEKKASFLNGKQYDLVIVESFLKEKDPSILNELEYASVIYKDIRDELAKMDVPNDIYTKHLNLVNAVHNLYLVVDDLSRETLFVDPLRVLSSVKKYTEYEEKIIETVSYLVNYSN